MSISLCTNTETLLTQVHTLAATSTTDDPEPLYALLMVDESALAQPLQERLDNLAVVDVTGPRLSRLNFDAISLVIVDLTPEALLTTAGRRLLDALGRLAEETLGLTFVGPATGATGAFLADGVTAGLNLIPRTVVLPDVQAAPDLRALLERTSQAGLRLLAMDGAVAVLYDYATDSVQVEGDGNALLAAYHETADAPQQTARLQIVAPGMQSGWPDRPTTNDS